MSKQQRLVVCLDGTWNRQDSSTNVLHHFNIVRQGPAGDGLIQKKYYHRGVGTGVLDSITGGGFGFGLEQNVRDAYNWLVEHYCDGEGERPPDEIYIFGFSRGAYTARSLVGFIALCGLLRRGAPIPVSQLWEQYCLLGRQKEERRSAWNSILWEPEAAVRPITKLVSDPWKKPAWKAGDLRPAEELLVAWSRRARIRYLGVYDTVGAIGWDALAIPGLSSRMALHNNMRPTTLVQHCRHALALDEHRSSFGHTPFRAFVGHRADQRELESDEADTSAADESPQGYWRRTHAMWRRKIEQRWFVGAHSNIGGGYEDNRLCQRPLEWVLEKAAELRLECEPVPCGPHPKPAQQLPRDSYAEFAPPLWTRILRAKPAYRGIDPDPIPAASTSAPEKDGPPPGFSLHTIHETLDDTVAAYWGNSGLPLPPNLEEYCARKKKPIPNATPSQHTWLPDRPGDSMAVVVWATLAAAGLFAAGALIGIAPSADGGVAVACAIAALLPLADWSESRVNFECARGAGGARARAFLDAVYWTRALGVALAGAGFALAAVRLGGMGWRYDAARFGEFAQAAWPVPICAAAGAVAASMAAKRACVKNLAWVAVAGPAAAAAIAAALFGAGSLSHMLFPEAPQWEARPDAHELSVPGLLVGVQLAIGFFWAALLWVGEPLTKANLGSILPLQHCRTPEKVAERFERWRRALTCRWDERDKDPIHGPAAVRLRDLLRESLWRDINGFIPAYSAVLAFALWFGSREILHAWNGVLAWWWLLPAIAAFTDYIEDACHLRFCRLHERGEKPSAGLALFSWSVSRVKDLAVAAGLALTIAVVLAGTWQVRYQLEDWRAKIATVATNAALAAVLVLAIARARHSLKKAVELKS